jgi:hypothetical protein
MRLFLGADFEEVMDLRQTNKAAFRKDKDRWSCVIDQFSPAVMVDPIGGWPELKRYSSFKGSFSLNKCAEIPPPPPRKKKLNVSGRDHLRTYT